MKQRNYYETTDKIITFIQKTFKEKGYKKAVIGISGGIDSAVVASLLVKALGKENVMGYSLPYGRQRDIDDTVLIMQKLGLTSIPLDIAPAVKSLKRTIGYKMHDVEGISIGNIKARVRMIILYDLSALHNALVIGTSNRTELELGYFTIHGDGACALEPIGHLYKTEVFELAKYLKISEVIINKAPSAGLWDGQTDEGELGYTYKQIDEMLDTIHNNTEDKPIPMINLYFDIVERVSKNKFKSELPKIIKEN